MAKKEIPEELKNYNKYPGEHVIALEELVKVGEKTFHLVKNYREGFDALELEHRYTRILDIYDYVVGDWGHERLRLKGFYDASRKKTLPDEKIEHVADYIQEYCNYGCAYFILQRVRQPGEVDVPYKDEKIYETQGRKPRANRNNDRNRNNNRDRADNRNRNDNRDRDRDRNKKRGGKYAGPEKKERPAKPSKKPANKPFTMRTRNDTRK